MRAWRLLDREGGHGHGDDGDGDTRESSKPAADERDLIIHAGRSRPQRLDYGMAPPASQRARPATSPRDSISAKLSSRDVI
jgi:hypothetical protein